MSMFSGTWRFSTGLEISGKGNELYFRKNDGIEIG